MAPDDPIPQESNTNNAGFVPVTSDEGLSDHEAAQFEAMRNGSDLPSDPPASPAEPAVPAASTPTPGEAPPAPAGDKKADPATPQPAPTDDDPDIDVIMPDKSKQKRVSIHKYQRLETKAEQMERELKEAREQLAKNGEMTTRLDERLKIINEALQTPAAGTGETEPAEEPMPDAEKDIFGAFNWVVKKLQATEGKLQEIQTGTVQQQEDTQLRDTYVNDAHSFAAKEPAFAAAYVHLIQQRDKELQLAGVADPIKRKQQITREERGLVKGAVDAGVSPAERIYQIAVARGFVKKPPEPPQPSVPAAGTALDAAVPPKPAAPAVPAAPVAQAVPSVTAEIEAIKRGTSAAMSLSNVGGGAPGVELTPQMLADMNEDEFNDLVARLPKSRLQELMGN